MERSFSKLLSGYHGFRRKYVEDDKSIMQYLSHQGQKPNVMVIACCDSRVDPALILQCDPGDLFVVRNVANIVPPYEKDEAHHGTSAALEFGINFLQVKHLILLGHSQCGGILSLLNNNDKSQKDDFITNWVSIVKPQTSENLTADQCAKSALNISYNNCLTFPWIRERLNSNELVIHQWFFDIEHGQIFTYQPEQKLYMPLS